MSKKNEIILKENTDLEYVKTEEYEDRHPWDDLSVFEILFGLFVVGMIIGLIMLIF